MFIECHHCHTIYRIDEKKIPSQECFVRCSKCLNPIKLKLKKLISSQALNKNVVECPECKTRYLVLSERIREKSLSVRCGDCDRAFVLANAIVTLDPDDVRSLSLLNDLYFEEKSSSEGSEIAMDKISIPKDFEADKEKGKKSVDRYEGDISKTALEDYLEAVALDSEEGKDDSKADIDPIPLEQKNKIFLRAYSKQIEADEKFVDATEKSVDADENTDKADSLPEETPLDKNAEQDAPQKEEPVPEKQEKQPIAPVDKGDKRTLLLIFIALILGALVIGGLLFFKNRYGDADFPTRGIPTSDRSGLVILEPLKGKYKTNKNEGKLFVIEGKVANHYPKAVKVSYLQIEGSLYNKYNREIGDSNVYAGNIMGEADLEKRTKIEIMSFLNNRRGKNKSNLNIKSKQVVPFQVVFFNAPDNVYKIGAKISDFVKR